MVARDALTKRVHRLPRFDGRTAQTWVAVLVVLAACLGPDLLDNDYWGGVLQLASIYVAASIFMGLLYVEAGQVSLGHGAVFAVGAYGVAVGCGVYGLPLWAGMVTGMLGGTALSLLFALPALRVQGFYLGFVTLSVAMVLPDMALTFDRYTRGVNGIPYSNLALAEPGRWSGHAASPLMRRRDVAGFSDPIRSATHAAGADDARVGGQRGGGAIARGRDRRCCGLPPSC